MNLGKEEKSPSLSLPLWSRTSTRLGIRRRSASRPAISAPFGPVKNSRGPDFSRSDTLVIVDGIEDCAYTNLPSLHLKSSVSEADRSKSSLVTATRRLSASYPHSPSAASPTVANSNITAATGIQVPLTKKPVNELRKATSTMPSRPFNHSGLRTSSTSSLLPAALEPFPRDENMPPGLDRDQLLKPPSQRPNGRLPPSKTINILQDLKYTPPGSEMRSTMLTSGKIKQAVLPVITTPALPVTKLQSIQSSQTSFLSHSVKSIHRDFDPQLVSEAQPSAYWSGRFMSLHDKYSSEALAPERSPHRFMSTPDKLTSNPRLPSSTGRKLSGVPCPTYLPHATTTSALLELPQAIKPRLKRPPPQPLQKPARDEDAQGRRIFGRLEALCTTDEARASLFQWQQSYARRTNRPNLLPEGGTMNGKSFVSKWFNSHGPKSGKRNFTVGREGSGGNFADTEPPPKTVEMHHFRATLT